MPQRHSYLHHVSYNSITKPTSIDLNLCIFFLYAMSKAYSEDDVNQALTAIGNGQSLRKAAMESGIPRSTLHHRLHGTQPWVTAFSDLQKLSTTQEDYLAHWIRIQAALGLPLTHQQLREPAGRVLQAKGDTQTLGKNWAQAFLKRNPSIKSLVQVPENPRD